MFNLLIAARLAVSAVTGPEAMPAAMVTIEPSEPRWLKHRVTPGERPIDVAMRYGVTVSRLAEWNGFSERTRRLQPGKKLQVLAARIPPPRRRVTYTAKAGESWTDIAVAHGIDSRLLRAYNPKVKRLRPGTRIALWIDPGRPRTIGVRRGPEVRALELAGAQSVGRPQVGRIRGAAQLPENDLYTRRYPKWSWGSTHTLSHLTSAIAKWRHQTGFEGPLVIGAVSRSGGGRFPPHRSHQSGRDVDIRLPVLPGFDDTRRPRPEEVDWLATWSLVESLIDTGEVELVLLERRLHRRLYEAARQLGASSETLARTIHSYDRRRWSTAIVRHSPGHAGHIHVRFRCGANESHCRG